MSQRKRNWDHRNVEKLLNFICEYPCLWDAENVSYKDSSARDSALDIIAQKMNMPKKDIRLKYGTLRTQYYKQRRMVNNRKWRYFDAMEFLMSGPRQQNEMEVNNKSDIRKIDEEHNHIDIVSIGLNDCANISAPAPTVPISLIHNGVMPQSQTEESLLLKENINLNTTKAPQKAQDEHAEFGEYIANELRRLGSQKYLQRKLKCAILEDVLNINRLY